MQYSAEQYARAVLAQLEEQNPYPRSRPELRQQWALGCLAGYLGLQMQKEPTLWLKFRRTLTKTQ